ncbi:MAG: hypothetical protein LBS64_00615, partial [Spirochaetaceae bacterium]|nr:hypothetical protein [Spirochaetaceae bacterium]
MTMLRDVDAILMASGFSRRFGGADKLLAQVWDKGSRVSQKPLARYTLDLAIGLAAAPDPCIARVYFVAANDAGALYADV